MQSSAWTNGQYLHTGQPSQSSQQNRAVVDNMKSQNAGSAHYISLYGQLNTGAKPQSSHSIHHNSVSLNQQSTILQSTSTYHYGTSQQLAAAETQDNLVLGFVVGYQQNPFPYAQVGNVAVPVQFNYGSQGGNKQIHHQTVPQDSLPTSKSKMINKNTSNTAQQQRLIPVVLPSYNMAISQTAQNCNGSGTTNASMGRLSASGVDQRISGYGKVAATSSAINSQTPSKDIQSLVLSKTNQPSGIPVANSPQQIAMFANDGFQSVISQAKSQLGANSPANDGNQLVGMVSMQQQQVLQSGTVNAIGSYNSNASQATLLQPLQPLPNITRGTTSTTWHNNNAQPLQPLSNTTCGTTSKTWHNNDAQPLQPLSNTTRGATSKTWHNKHAHILQLLLNTTSSSSSSSTSTTCHNKDAQSQQPFPMKDSPITAIGNQSGNHFQGGNAASAPKGTPFASLFTDIQSGIQMNNTQSSGEHVKGQKAVAVVQPLSNTQVANNVYCEPTTPEKAPTSPTFLKASTNLADGTNSLNGGKRIHEEPSNASKSSKSFDSHSTPSNCGSVAASSGSTEPADSLQRRLSTGGTESSHHISPTVDKSQSDKMPQSPNGVNDRKSTPTVHDDTPVKTVLWTMAKLHKLINGTMTAKAKSENVPNVSCISKILSIFWGDNLRTLISKLESGSYKDIMMEVKQFCSKHLKSDSVILSQIKRESRDKLPQSCIVLKPNDVYREEPYASSWLNVNKQLNDIDDEFGLPFCLRYYHMQPAESPREPDPAETISKVPAETMRKVTCTKTEVERGNCATEDSEIDKTSPEHPLEAESPSSVDMYSFKIQVLPPEEAKVLYEQEPQKKASEDQPATVLNTTEDNPLETTEENESASAIEEFCCIARFMQILEYGPSSECSCQCKGGLSREDDAEPVHHEDQQKEDKLDGIIHHVVEDGEVAADGQLKVFNWPEVGSEFGDSVELTGDDGIFASCPDKDPDGITLLSEGDSSSIILISESEDEILSSIEADIPNKEANPEEALAPDEQETSQRNEQSSSDAEKTENSSSEDEISSRSESKTENSSSEDEMSPRPSGAQGLKSPAVPQKPLESQAQTPSDVTMKDNFQEPLSPTGTHATSGTKRSRLPSPERFFSFLKKLKKTKVKDDAKDIGVTAGEGQKGRTVELALFGSAPQEDDVLKVGSRSHLSAVDLFPDHGPKPPEVISVSLNPRPKTSGETAQRTRPYTAKEKVYEKWKDLSPVNIKYRRRTQTQNCAALSEVRHETDGPLGKKELSDRRFCSAKRKHRLTSRSPYKDRRRGRKRRKKEAFALKQSAEEHTGFNPGNRSYSLLPLQEENVLVFRVLPNTFNFKEMPDEENDTAVPKASSSAFDQPDPGIKNKESNLPDKISRGKWAPNPERKCSPQPQTMDPNISSIFHEFQKKYLKKKPHVD